MSRRALLTGRYPAPGPVLALTLGTMLLLAACGAAAEPSASPAPSATMTPAPTPVITPASDSLEHPTAAGDVILQISLRGGFVRMEYLMARVPLFSLFGDGRVLLVAPDAVEGPLAGGPAGAIAWPALREVRLTEAEIQDVLAFALAEGGLGTAKPEYPGDIMDAAATVFEVHGGGVDRTVTVNALGPDPAPGPEAGPRRALALLLGKMQAISTAGAYVPERYVAIIAETQPDAANPAPPWPWADLAPGTFIQPADTDPVPFLRHLLTTVQVKALGFDVGPGGASGFRLAGPDGKTYAVTVRPALPDEIGAG